MISIFCWSSQKCIESTIRHVLSKGQSGNWNQTIILVQPNRFEEKKGTKSVYKFFYCRVNVTISVPIYKLGQRAQSSLGLDWLASLYYIETGTASLTQWLIFQSLILDSIHHRNS